MAKQCASAECGSIDCCTVRSFAWRCCQQRLPLRIQLRRRCPQRRLSQCTLLRWRCCSDAAVLPETVVTMDSVAVPMMRCSQRRLLSQWILLRWRCYQRCLFIFVAQVVTFDSAAFANRAHAPSDGCHDRFCMVAKMNSVAGDATVVSMLRCSQRRLSMLSAMLPSESCQ